MLTVLEDVAPLGEVAMYVAAAAALLLALKDVVTKPRSPHSHGSGRMRDGVKLAHHE